MQLGSMDCQRQVAIWLVLSLCFCSFSLISAVHGDEAPSEHGAQLLHRAYNTVDVITGTKSKYIP